jgi:hypothetical protein
MPCSPPYFLSSSFTLTLLSAGGASPFFGSSFFSSFFSPSLGLSPSLGFSSFLSPSFGGSYFGFSSFFGSSFGFSSFLASSNEDSRESAEVKWRI